MVVTRLSFPPPCESLGTMVNCTMVNCTMHFNSFNQNQSCTALVVESVHNHCCSTSVHLLRSRTWRVGLTLVSEGSGSLAKLQPIHKLLLLWSGSYWGCRMSANKRWEVVQQTSSLRVRYIWSWYFITETQYQTLCVSLWVSRGLQIYHHDYLFVDDVMDVRNNWTLWETLQMSPPLSLSMLWAWNKATVTTH